MGGCPHSSVISPLVWYLVVYELLDKLRTEEFLVYDYAKDRKNYALHI